jgi:hypothetical protein
MKVQIAVIFATLLSIAGVARAEMVDFKSAEHRISIKHPDDWKPAESTQAGVIARFVTPLDGESDKYQEEFTIKVLEMNQEAEINELIDSIKPTLAQQLPGYVEKSDEKVTIAGRPGRKLVSEVTTQYSPIRATQWFVVDGTRLIIITLNTTPATAEQYRSFGQAMVDSLTIEKKS